ncbi:MAG: glycosyltransferase family 4 protein [Geminicoccaceae bacterium]
MRIAFYAPLKPIDHPTPSGDRRMARSFKSLLEELGHEVVIASSLRSFDRSGDVGHQEYIREAAAREACKILACPGSVPDLWFTYHAYHKAPDWIGPEVSAHLGIPYIVAEASIAGKQANGPWAMGHEATLSGLASASHLLAMTTVDLAGLREHLPAVDVSHFPPFIDCAHFSAKRDRTRIAGRFGLPEEAVWIVAVAMMRNDIKRRSFELLAAAFEQIDDHDVHLVIAGDGEARTVVEDLFANSAPRVHFLGLLDPGAVATLLSSADLMLWPALREAYGLAMLEAQAAGLPVVACREGGVGDIIADGLTGILVNERDAHALAAAVRYLLDNETIREAMGKAAKSRVHRVHDVAVAAERLSAILNEVRPCV